MLTPDGLVVAARDGDALEPLARARILCIDAEGQLELCPCAIEIVEPVDQELSQRTGPGITAGKPGSAPMFSKKDGSPWFRNNQRRPLARACAAASIDPPATFHVLRHTHASQLAMRGVPLQVIAAQLGHAGTHICEKHYAHLSPSFVADTIRANMPVFGIVKGDTVAPLHQRR